MRQFLPLFYLGFSLVLLSCIKDVNIDIPGSTPQPVLNVLLQTGDSIVNASINISVPYQSTRQPSYVGNAAVNLYENGVWAGLLEVCERNPFFNNNTNDTQYVYCIPYPVQAGYTYRVVADIPGFPTISGQTTVPGKAEISTIRLDSATQLLTFRISDNEPAINYYRIEIHNVDTLSPGLSSQLSFSTKDYSLELLGASNELVDLPIDDPIGTYVFTTDELFPGGAKEIQLTLFLKDPLNSSQLSILITKCSKEFYEFSRTNILNTFNGGNPFNEPVQIYTNIEDGLGIVGAFNQQYYSVEF